MHRKTKELLLLLLLAIIIWWFDPVGVGANSRSLRDDIFALVVYAVPAAFVTILLSGIYHRNKAVTAPPAKPKSNPKSKKKRKRK
ncbi:hypothetical protein OAO01_02020 [Oligoflexia bacterium]|nr:hypothetical protein [Oligoflexia bacterium]